MILDATAPHTRVDNFVIDEYLDRIGVHGLAIYTVIKRHYNWMTGQCIPSYARIAEICHISRSTVIRYVKRLKEYGLILKTMRFTDEGQTSNQYGFYQPARPKSAQKNTSEQKSTTAQPDTAAQKSLPVSQEDPPGITGIPDQVDLNKREEKENAKSVPLKEREEEETQGTEKTVAWQAPEKPEPSEKTVPTGKQKACPHPYAEVVTFGDDITICNHCFTLINFLPDTRAA